METTSEVAVKLKRNSVGIDVMQEYADLAQKTVNEYGLFLLEEKETYVTN